MNSMPLLSLHNHFNVLYIEQINNIDTKTQDMQKPDPCHNKSQMETIQTMTFSSNTLQMEAFPSMTFSVQTCCPKWKRSLPQKFVIAVTEGDPT